MLNFERKKKDFSFSMTDLDSLENTIGRAMNLIQTLYQKNTELNDSNKKLINLLNEKEKEINKFSEENLSIRNNDFSHFDKTKENKIRIKVQQILEKLENVEKLNNN